MTAPWLAEGDGCAGASRGVDAGVAAPWATGSSGSACAGARSRGVSASQQNPGSRAAGDRKAGLNRNFRDCWSTAGLPGSRQSSVRGSRPGFRRLLVTDGGPARRRPIRARSLPISPRGALGLSNARHASNRCGDGMRPRYSEHESSQARGQFATDVPRDEVWQGSRDESPPGVHLTRTDASSGPQVMPAAPIFVPALPISRT